MNEKVAVSDLFKRGPKRGDERLRQIADKTDRVVDDDLLLIRQPKTPGCRVQGGDLLFFRVKLSLLQCVVQSRFDCVGLAVL